MAGVELRLSIGNLIPCILIMNELLKFLLSLYLLSSLNETRAKRTGFDQLPGKGYPVELYSSMSLYKETTDTYAV